MIIESKQIRSIKYIVSLGWYLANEAPEIASAYRSGVTQESIARAVLMSNLQTEKISDNIPISILSQAVGFALKGNKNLDNGQPYFGLMPLEEYIEISKRNREQARKKGTRKTSEERLGFHSLSQEVHKENARKSALARGRKPWLEAEVSLASMMRYENQRQYQDIATELNRTYHENQSIRTENTVREALRRTNGKKS